MNTTMPLRDLFIDELRDLYNAERQLTKALPKLAKNSTSEDLRSAIETHLTETEGHVQRLEQIFELLDAKAKGKHCAGIAGIIEESSDLLHDSADGSVLDAGIIAGAQRAEHYEIAAYGSVVAWAEAMGEREVVDLLRETLEEEKNANTKLTQIAEQHVNADALAASRADGEDRDTSRGRRHTGSSAASRSVSMRQR